MSRSDKNAQAALDWAKKKKEQMERAKQIREERKMKMHMAAENTFSGPAVSSGFRDPSPSYDYAKMGAGMDKGLYDLHKNEINKNYSKFNDQNMPDYSNPPPKSYSNGHRGGYGSSNYRPSSNEEIAEARQSLMLLKTKMKHKNPTR
jgi:hypothetical protein